MPKTITFTKKFLINDWNDPNKTALTEYVTSLKVRDKLLGYSNIYTDTVNIPTIVASATVISTLNTLSISNPLQGLFDIFPSGLKLGLIPNIISGILFSQELKLLHYILNTFCILMKSFVVLKFP